MTRMREVGMIRALVVSPTVENCVDQSPDLPGKYLKLQICIDVNRFGLSFYKLYDRLAETGCRSGG